jgi:hypothetical protein
LFYACVDSTVYTLISCNIAGKDLGKTDEAEKYQALIWVAPYAHILIASYGQAYSADGTHCMSIHGWRAIPLCVLNSLGNPVAIGIAWAPTENAGVMTDCMALGALNSGCAKFSAQDAL